MEIANNVLNLGDTTQTETILTKVSKVRSDTVSVMGISAGKKIKT